MKTAISGVEVSEKETSIPIKMLHHRVAVKHMAEEVESKDGVATKKIEGSNILAPGTANETHSKGVIVSVGEGDENYPVVVKPGDTVLYFRQQSHKYEFDGVEYDIIDAMQLVAIL